MSTVRNKAMQKRFYADLNHLPSTGEIGGKRHNLCVYDELFEFAQCSGNFTTTTKQTASILRSYGFKVVKRGVGWVVTSC
jgi:hypothetical protein